MRRDSYTTRRPGRIDWPTLRDSLDLAEVVARLIGPPSGRRGGRSARPWWRCPLGTHRDENPSFTIQPDRRAWHCFGCGASGDAVALVRRLFPSMTFPEAVAYLQVGGPSATVRRPSTPRPEPSPEPEGMARDAATALVAEAEARLWTPEAAHALDYLTGPRRKLAPETIRAARLGWTPSARATNRAGRSYGAQGIVVSWFVGNAPALVKVRQPEPRRPKYAEVFRDRTRHLGLYPGPEAIQTGRPLVIVEGEFDALLLGQEIGDMAGVVTLGSASGRPGPDVFRFLLSAAPWFVATDADDAGETAAAGWPAPARRIRPPAPFKDWTEARASGVDLRRWWSAILAGRDAPPLFPWDDLAAWRWGPGVADSEPGIVR